MPVEKTIVRPALTLPDGLIAAPIHAASPETPLRLCVVARRAPDPLAGHFVVLRQTADGTAYLGCITDAAGRISEWIELWVQSVEGLAGSLPALREAFSNAELDRRWLDLAKTLAALEPEQTLVTGWEEKHPAPRLIDLARSQSAALGGDAGWVLCQDDSALEAAGLPAFRKSLYRYLWQPATGPAAGFAVATAGAPENDKTVTLDETLGGQRGNVFFNPQGGLMRAARLAPIPYDDYADLLGGKPWKGVEQGKKPLNFGGPYRDLEDWSNLVQGGAHLLASAKGRAGRVAETFHLKLALLTDAARQVRSVIAAGQLPLLNLAADSFRVGLREIGAGLPLLWTARASFVKPGEAFALPVENTESRYFIRARPSDASIYLPEGIGASLRGSGSVRLRQVQAAESNRLIIEGTLVLQERQAFSAHDLFWIRLPLAAGRVDLYGHLYSAESLARAEVRFHTVPQSFPDSVAKALKAAEGASFPRSPFEVVPLLSSPCDLYSLGVLAVRTLLVNEQNTLAVALDEMLSLARQMGSEPQNGVSLGERVRALVTRDERFLEAVGPHRLVREELDPHTALAFLPEALWCEALGVIARLFPGVGPDSVCRDFGDVPALALETVFDQPLAELERLLIRSRSLLAIDWHANREIQGVISEFQARGTN